MMRVAGALYPPRDPAGALSVSLRWACTFQRTAGTRASALPPLCRKVGCSGSPSARVTRKTRPKHWPTPCPHPDPREQMGRGFDLANVLRAAVECAVARIGSTTTTTTTTTTLALVPAVPQFSLRVHVIADHHQKTLAVEICRFDLHICSPSKTKSGQ